MLVHHARFDPVSNPLPQNFYVKAVALRLLIDLSFSPLGKFLELFLNLLDAFNNRA